jgi:hypothetical protein
LLCTETGWTREKIGGLLWYGCRDKHRRCDHRLDHNSCLTRCSHSSSLHCQRSLRLLWQTCNHAAPTNQHVSLLKKQGTPTTSSSSSWVLPLPACISLCVQCYKKKRLMINQSSEVCTTRLNQSMMNAWLICDLLLLWTHLCETVGSTLILENLDSSNWVGVDAAADVTVEHPGLEPMTWIGC